MIRQEVVKYDTTALVQDKDTQNRYQTHLQDILNKELNDVDSNPQQQYETITKTIRKATKHVQLSSQTPLWSQNPTTYLQDNMFRDWTQCMHKLRIKNVDQEGKNT